jgi:hypothetical protein
VTDRLATYFGAKLAEKRQRTLCGQQDGWKYIKTLRRSILLLAAHTPLAVRKYLCIVFKQKLPQISTSITVPEAK